MNLNFAKEAEEAAKNLTWWQEFRLKVFGSKLVIDYEISADGKAKYPLYLFWCKSCSHYAKSRRSGKRRLYCSFCSEIHYLSSKAESKSIAYEIEKTLGFENSVKGGEKR